MNLVLKLIQLTQEFIKVGAGTEHLDTQRERLNNAKINLLKLLKKLQKTNIVDFTEEKFNENLPRLINVIEEIKNKK